MLHSQINNFSWGYLTEGLPVFRLFLINSYQFGILLKIKRKLELNMYLDIRIYLKSLPFLLSVRKQPPGRHCANECSWEFCGIRGGAPVLGLFFNKVAGL